MGVVVRALWLKSESGFGGGGGVFCGISMQGLKGWALLQITVQTWGFNVSMSRGLGVCGVSGLQESGLRALEFVT